MTDTTCPFEDCNQQSAVMGFCRKHYDSQRVKPTRARDDNPRKCSIQGCDRGHVAKGYCSTHYYRLRKFGTAEFELPTNCQFCSEKMPPPKGRTSVRKYCSSNCGAKARYYRSRDKINAEKRAENAAKRNSLIKQCKQCGASFSPEKMVTQEFCSKRCGNKHHYANSDKTCSIPGCAKTYVARGYCASHYNQILKPDRHKKKRLVPCAACGVEVEKHASSGSRRAVCSYRCRSFLSWGFYPPSTELVGPVPKMFGPERPPKGYVNPYAVDSGNPDRLFVQGCCRWCGESFTAMSYRSMSLPRYCSERCMKKWRRKLSRKRRGRFAVPDRLRFDIYERDGWVCQLCFTPTSKVYDHDDPLSPTLDHIVAQANGGSDDPENLRLSHAICNSERGTGDGSGAELLGLFAF